LSARHLVVLLPAQLAPLCMCLKGLGEMTEREREIERERIMIMIMVTIMITLRISIK